MSVGVRRDEPFGDRFRPLTGEVARSLTASTGLGVEAHEVERRLAKSKAAGSSPVYPSMLDQTTVAAVAVARERGPAPLT